MPRSPENGERLKAVLPTTFQSGDVDVVYRLLWGYNKEDARDRTMSDQLVDWLEHDHIAVRELAIYHIYRLTGQKREYLPHKPAAQRKAAVNRWRDLVDKQGALLP